MNSPPQRTTAATAHGQTARQTRQRTGFGAGSPRAVLIVMCVGYFLVLLDVTIVNVALPQIGAGLRTGVSGLQWVVDGYTLALASLMLAGGTAGDLHGHKRIVLAGLAVFGAGSLGCGLAPAAAVLVAARAVQGVGAALLLPGTLAIITRAYPDGPGQARAIGIWAGIGSLALPAGPLLGGVLITGFGWRAIFLLNVPIVVLSFAATVAIVRESSEARTRRMDLRGVVLGALFLLAATFAVIQAGGPGADAAAVIAATGAAVLLAGAFVVTEWRRGEAAMLPLSLFKDKVFPVANGAAGAMNLGTLGMLFVTTLFLQSLQHRSPLTVGAEMFPLFAPLAVIAPLAGRLTSRIGPRIPVTAGFVIAAAGLALLLADGARSGYLLLLPAFLLWGIGLGVLTPAVVAASIAAVPGERAGLGSAINNTARQAGGAVGVAVAGAIAGQPHAPGFLHGFHAVAVGAAGLYLLSALIAVILIPGVLPWHARSS
jgi:DHA2 family methylenomycin A resistance protein-like MFS transporter